MQSMDNIRNIQQTEIEKRQKTHI